MTTSVPPGLADLNAHLARKNPTGFEDALRMVSPTGFSTRGTNSLNFQIEVKALVA
jgi:hypothetical protein